MIARQMLASFFEKRSVLPQTPPLFPWLSVKQWTELTEDLWLRRPGGVSEIDQSVQICASGKSLFRVNMPQLAKRPLSLENSSSGPITFFSAQLFLLVAKIHWVPKSIASNDAVHPNDNRMKASVGNTRVEKTIKVDAAGSILVCQKEWTKESAQSYMVDSGCSRFHNPKEMTIFPPLPHYT